MTIRRSHGKARPELPRSEDLAAAQTAGEPDGQRNAGGLFAPNNDRARDWGLKFICRGHATPFKGELAELSREAAKLFRGFVRELPLDTLSVRQQCAQRARNAVLAARYTALAAEKGLGTAEGDAALEMALKLEAAATRGAVVALDLATKLAARNRKQKPASDAVDAEYQRFVEARDATPGSEP